MEDIGYCNSRIGHLTYKRYHHVLNDRIDELTITLSKDPIYIGRICIHKHEASHYADSSIKEYYHNKPLVYNVEVDKQFRRQGLGTILYFLGVKYTFEVWNLPLYASNIRTKEALAMWNKFKQLGLATDSKRPSISWK